MQNEIVPNDSRFVPLTAQKFLCVPTCIQMVMLKEKMELVSAELLGEKLGLRVPDEFGDLFWGDHGGEKPKAGWGTQVGKFSADEAFLKLGIGLKMKMKLASEFENEGEVFDWLKKVEEEDRNVLICFEVGVLEENEKADWGHVCVFDRMDDGKIRLIDSACLKPKWRLVEIEKMWEAMKKHGVENLGGFWELVRI